MRNWVWCAVGVLCVVAGHAGAQGAGTAGACGAAPIVNANAKPNIFSPQQEEWLGEAWRDEIEGSLREVNDPSLSAYVQGLADRLAKNLPEPHVKFRVVLIESAEVNAFSIPGGNIYVMRKLAASTKSEDELAAVLGHEMGHIASHQFAFEVTAELKRLLGVTSVGDRADVYARFQQLRDAQMNDKHPQKQKEDDAQDEADRVGVYLMAAAGFRANAFPEFFDRTSFVNGKTGSRLSDFFGMTKPGEKRLRGMRTLVAALPSGCGTGTVPATEEQAFAEWRERVIEDRKATPTVAASESTKVMKLDPPLQMELNRLRFSPDGKLLLAQDESSIYVISTETHKVNFRIDAEDAQPAWFSPDSKRVTFATRGFHTEQWSATDGKLLAAHEPTTDKYCMQLQLTPDGRTLICMSPNTSDAALDLRLMDADTGKEVWSKRPFFHPTYGFAVELELSQFGATLPDLVWSSYSSDENFALIGPGSDKIALDLRTRLPIKIGSDLRENVTGPQAFLGNDRVAGVSVFDPKSSGIYSFPEGKRIEKRMIPFTDMEAVSNPGAAEIVMTHTLFGKPADISKEGVKAFNQHPEQVEKIQQKVGVADLSQTRFAFSSKTYAMDVWNDTVTTEGSIGTVVLARPKDGKFTDVHQVQLPTSPLGRLQTVALSPDGKWLVYSTRDRGGIWNTQTGKLGMNIKPFRHAAWVANDRMFADFEKSAKGDREIVEFDLGKHSANSMNVELKKGMFLSFGVLLEWQEQKSMRTLLVHRLGDNAVLWSKTFPDGYPWYTASFGWKDLIFTVNMNNEEAKAALKTNPVLAEQAKAIKDKDRARFIEIMDAQTGKVLNQVVLNTPADYSGTGGLNRLGDVLLVTGADNRTVAFSLATGKQLWQVFGEVVALDAEHNRVCLANRQDEVMIYGADGKELLHERNGQTVRFAAFEQQGSKLMLLLADQSLRTIEVPVAGAQVAAR